MKLSDFSVVNYRSITTARKIKTNNMTVLVGILAGHFGFTGPVSTLNFLQDFGLILFTSLFMLIFTDFIVWDYIL